MTGKFKCLNELCKLEFEHSWFPGLLEHPDSHAGITCKLCGSNYVEWVNYEKLFGKDKK